VKKATADARMNERHKDDKDDRGAVFQASFIVGVRALYIEAYMQAHAEKKGTKKSTFDLETLNGLADDLLVSADEADSEKHLLGEVDPGFVSSFYIYPRAEALSTKAYYHRNKAREAKKKADCKRHLEEAARLYEEAARKYSRDEEYFLVYMHSAISAHCSMGSPLRVILPMISEIRAAMPLVKRIWEHSALAIQGRDLMMNLFINFEDAVTKRMERGELTGDDVRLPDGESIEELLR